MEEKAGSSFFRAEGKRERERTDEGKREGSVFEEMGKGSCRGIFQEGKFLQKPVAAPAACPHGLRRRGGLVP